MIPLLTSLSGFQVCLSLAVLLLIVLGILAGEALLMFYFTFPLLLARLVTDNLFMVSLIGERKSKSLTHVLNSVLAVVFALLTVPLLAGILYGVYWLASRHIPWFTAAPALPPAASAHLRHLLLINNLLWFLAALLLGLQVLSTWGNLRAILRMRGAHILSGYVVPLLRHGLAFLILPATAEYLLHYPDPNAYPDLTATLAAVAYANLWLYMQAYHLVGRERRRSIWYRSPILEGSFFRVMGVPYGLLFCYLLVQVFVGV